MCRAERIFKAGCNCAGGVGLFLLVWFIAQLL
jgi:hypothetical protein